MQVVRSLIRSAGLATVVAVVVVEWSSGGVVAGLFGALSGALLTGAAGRLGLLVSAPVTGLTLRRLVVGAGPRLADWSTPRRTVVLRAVPVVLSVSLRATKAPVRPRLWVSALCALACQVATATAAVQSMTGSFTRGAGVAAVVTAVLALVPRLGNPAWLLFRMPWAGPEIARRMAAAPAVHEAVAAARSGDLALAERRAAGLRESYPDLCTALAARMSVLAAQGRFAEAVILAVKLTSAHLPDPRSFAALAGLTCATVEAGQLDAEVGVSTAVQAIESAATLGYPDHRLNGTRAMVALLRGDPRSAITLARLAAGTGDDVLVRADDLATLARAHMAAGDNRTARQVLTEAERLAKWWPRVAGTRTRLEVAG